MQINDIIQPLFNLAAVVIGGFISYKAQRKHQQNIEIKNDKRQKQIAYNKFLLYDGEKNPLIVPVHKGHRRDFNWSNYINGNRAVLFENLHLLDKTIVKNVLKMDYLSEKMEVMGPEQEDIDLMYSLYVEISEIIKEECKDTMD